MSPLLDPLLLIVKVILKTGSNKKIQVEKSSKNQELNSVLALFEAAVNDDSKISISPTKLILSQME